METWKEVIGVLAYLSLGIGAISAYLQLNKVWSRKHREEVANSISIAGHVMTIIPLIIFGLNFLVVAQWQGFINSIIWICWGSMMILIGSGLWIKGNRKKGLWNNVKRALRLEKSEVGDLAMALIRPASADLLLRILTEFAWIDDELDEREKQYIQNFADSWNLEVNWSVHGSTKNNKDLHANLTATHELVDSYLLTSPPSDQVDELADVLTQLTQIDDEVTEAEEILLEEVLAMLTGYKGDDGGSEHHAVVIAPRSEEQTNMLKALIPDSEEVAVAGGWGYVVGNYCSLKYAKTMCEQFRKQGFFTVTMAMETTKT